MAFVCLPAPILFYKYGAAIRARCKYTRLAEEAVAGMMEKKKKEEEQPDPHTRSSDSITLASADGHSVMGGNHEDEAHGAGKVRGTEQVYGAGKAYR